MIRLHTIKTFMRYTVCTCKTNDRFNKLIQSNYTAENTIKSFYDKRERACFDCL